VRRLHEPQGITDLATAGVRFIAAAVAYLRCLPEFFDGHTNDNDQIWVDGSWYAVVRERWPTAALGLRRQCITPLTWGEGA
jgi:hypothetical protein